MGHAGERPLEQRLASASSAARWSDAVSGCSRASHSSALFASRALGRLVLDWRDKKGQSGYRNECGEVMGIGCV